MPKIVLKNIAKTQKEELVGIRKTNVKEMASEEKTTSSYCKSELKKAKDGLGNFDKFW